MFRVPAKKRMRTTRKQLAGMKRRLAELRLCEAHGGIGTGGLPVARKLTDTVRSFTNWVSSSKRKSRITSRPDFAGTVRRILNALILQSDRRHSHCRVGGRLITRPRSYLPGSDDKPGY